jgi:hypothetical protein
MANVKISQLPVTGSPSTTGLLPIVQDGTTYSTTAADLVALVTDTDIDAALGYTPVSPTTLATTLADYVPEARTITINGTTQDLSTNRTWTLDSGAPTYPFTGSNINIGESVVINSDGTVSSVVSPSMVPTANISSKGVVDYGAGYSTLVSMIRSKVSPHDSSTTVTGYIDNSSTTLYIQLKQVNDTEIVFVQGSPLSITSGVSTFDIQFDPFNPNLILVLYNQSSTMYAQYLFINRVYSNGSVNALTPLGTPIFIGNNWSAWSFQFSEKHPNTFVAQWSDASSGQLPYVQSFISTQYSTNSFSITAGAAQSLGINGYYGPGNSVQVLNRLEGTDTFIASLNPYDGTLSAYVNQVVLFQIDLAYSDYSVPPVLTLGTAYTMVDYTNPNYQYSGTYGAFFISSTKIAYTIKASMGSNFYVVIGNVSGLTVNSVGSPNEYLEAVTNSFSNQTVGVTAMPINKDYILFVGKPTSGININNVVASIGKVTGTTIVFSSDIVLAIYNGSPDGVPIELFSGGASGIVLTPSIVSGLANVNMAWGTQSSSGYMYSKVSIIEYIDKVFTNQTLLGIAQNTVTTSATVNVLPFGNVDDNQSGLVAGTSYYLQDDGTVTTNVTPTPLGTALSSALIKTVNYPTI